MSNLFDAQTKDQIESRMVQTLHTLTDTDKTSIEGSFARDMIDTNAVEFENSYAEMAMLRDAAFAETAWGDYLTLRAEEFGIQRKQAVKANAGPTSSAAACSRPKTVCGPILRSRQRFRQMGLSSPSRFRQAILA